MASNGKQITQPRAGAHIASVMGDASGAFADLGTFLPLVSAMLLLGSFEPTRVLIGFGLFSALTGVVYRRPVPTQPMKAIAAMAITGTLSSDAVFASGMIVGATLLVLAASGGIARLQRIVPGSALTGIQIGLGISLILAALKIPDVDTVVGAALFLLLIAIQFSPLKSIGALGLLVGGLATTVASGAAVPELAPHAIPTLMVQFPDWQSFMTAAWIGAPTQLAMTLTNAILVTASLSAEYFPDDRKRLSARNFAVSSGAMNLLLAPFGAIPMCHGAGGLAAQYGQGARTGLAPIIFGCACLILAIAAGASAVQWLLLIPAEIICALLAFAGFQLMSAKTLPRDDTFSLFVIAVTAAMTVAVNAALGLVAGLVLVWIRTAFAPR